MGAFSAVAPFAAVRLADRMFLRPPDRPLKSFETAWMDGAERLTLATPTGPRPGWRWGAGDRTVLLVHGWGGRALQFGAVGRALATRGYSAVAWDLPGHGDRGATTNLPTLAASVAAVAERVGPPAGVVAHSFGTAATLVAHHLHGVRVPRLVGIAPTVFLLRTVAQFQEMTGFSDAVMDRMCVRLANRLGFDWDELDGKTIAPALHCPALIIHDRGDERVPFSFGADLADLLPGSTLVETASLGHSGPLYDEQVVQRVADFFPA